MFACLDCKSKMIGLLKGIRPVKSSACVYLFSSSEKKVFLGAPLRLEFDYDLSKNYEALLPSTEFNQITNGLDKSKLKEKSSFLLF